MLRSRMDDPPRGTAPTQLSQADPAAPAELAVGSDRLIAGRYEVLERIGGGAMGAVFRVRDRTLDEVVALKVLHGELQRSPDMQQRFRQEVKLARRVTHANVARTYDIGQHEGTWFLTMELVEGESLAQLIERRAPLPCEEALAIASQVCAGLVAAHEAGVIHRDLKPENIRLGPGGRVVLLDFGIARQHLPEGGRSTLGMLGTPAYMAPEQVSGAEQIDERADIYAFGTVLFELSTGKLAWPGSSPFAVANARLSSPPPDPRATGAEVDPELAALVSRCLARDPAQRFASARELGVALERLRATQPVTDPVPAASRSVPASGAGDRFVRKHGVEALDEDLAKQLRLRRQIAAVPARLGAAPGAAHRARGGWAHGSAVEDLAEAVLRRSLRTTAASAGRAPLRCHGGGRLAPSVRGSGDRRPERDGLLACSIARRARARSTRLLGHAAHASRADQ